jgi:hypothetical protein
MHRHAHRRHADQRADLPIGVEHRGRGVHVLSPGSERVDRLQDPSARDFDPLAINPAMAFGKKGRDHWADIAR